MKRTLHLFGNRIAKEKQTLQALAKEKEPRPAPDHGDLLKNVRELNKADHIDEWLSSPGLRAPR
jgi:hypothetical protein